jgi:hypothetical protein
MQGKGTTIANDAAHYRELAARAQTEADQATLDNVRDRALRFAAAFETMALQHEGTAPAQNAKRRSLAMPPATRPMARVSPTHKEQT